MKNKETKSMKNKETMASNISKETMASNISTIDPDNSIKSKLSQLVFDAQELERRLVRLSTDENTTNKATNLRQAIEFARDSLTTFTSSSSNN